MAHERVAAPGHHVLTTEPVVPVTVGHVVEHVIEQLARSVEIARLESRSCTSLQHWLWLGALHDADGNMRSQPSAGGGESQKRAVFAQRS